MRKITCISEDYSITAGETGFTPFLLAGIDGIYGAKNDLIISKNAMTDGGTFQGTTANVRNIVLRLMIEPNHVWRQDVRSLLYSVFSKNSVGKFVYQENEDKRYTMYRVESIEQSEWNKRIFTVSLLCDDPFFYSTEDIHQQMASIVSDFEFVHEFTAEGEELGHRSAERIVTFSNDTGVDGIGMTINILCVGEVTNPKVTRVEGDESITLGTAGNQLELEYGDVITITTGNNNKHVFLTRSGVKTEINQYLTEDSVFIQLGRGINNIGYSASSGEDYMVVDLSYTPQYEGA